MNEKIEENEKEREKEITNSRFLSYVQSGLEDTLEGSHDTLRISWLRNFNILFSSIVYSLVSRVESLTKKKKAKLDKSKS